MQIEEALGRYRLQLAADGRSDHTARQVTRHVRLFADWVAGARGGREVEELRHEDVAAFLASDRGRLRADGRPRKPNAANALRSSLRVFFGYVHAAGYARVNAAALVRRARCGSPPPRGLSETDRERLVGALDTAKTPAEWRDRALFRLLLGAGLRLGSAIALDVEDVDLAAGEVRLRIMKNADRDVAFVPAGLVEILRKHAEGRTAGPLFLGEHGGRIGARQAHRRLAWWAERAGIAPPVSPHRLRHTFATRVYGGTQDLLVTARALCHRSPASSAVYARVDPAAVRRAIGAG